VKNKKIN